MMTAAAFAVWIASAGAVHAEDGDRPPNPYRDLWTLAREVRHRDVERIAERRELERLEIVIRGLPASIPGDRLASSSAAVELGHDWAETVLAQGRAARTSGVELDDRLARIRVPPHSGTLPATSAKDGPSPTPPAEDRTTSLGRRVDDLEQQLRERDRRIRELEQPEATAPGLATALETERSRRQTLEAELERLSAAAGMSDQLETLWSRWQAARAEVFLLQDRLASERERREALEVAIARAMEASGHERTSPEAWLERVATHLEERRRESERLEADLYEARESIVRLRGHLEVLGSGEGQGDLLRRLQEDNEGLEAALARARASNERLRDRAKIAEQVTELLYD